jgi:hypothetical protein
VAVHWSLGYMLSPTLTAPRDVYNNKGVGFEKCEF